MTRPMSLHELYGPPKVGGDALAYCTRCKMDLAHVIVSMMGGKPARVICKTCKSQHNFKLGVKTASKTPRTSSGAGKREVVEVRASEYWQKRIAEVKGEPKVYALTQTYAKGDVLQHATYGLGIVEEVRLGGKVLVLFRVGDKVLVHGMKPSAQPK